MAATPPATMLTAALCKAYLHGVQTFAQIPGVDTLAQVKVQQNAGQAQSGAALFSTNAETFLGNRKLMEELFGPATLVVECASREQMLQAAKLIEGQLTATIHATPTELAGARDLVAALTAMSGRLIFNGFPTGVEVAHAMTHGGPYPATSDGRSTSVGTRAIERFLRPVSFQNFPDEALPPELQEANPLQAARLVDGAQKV
jgi:NADP-dependent aldehyde dehydrogenase